LQVERQTTTAASPNPATALLEDISFSGACFSSDTAIKTGEPVTLHCQAGDLPGLVRYCFYRDDCYFAGIEFTYGCKWPSDFEPAYLLASRSDSGRVITGAD
jgi:hypothetical protein